MASFVNQHLTLNDWVHQEQDSEIDVGHLLVSLHHGEISLFRFWFVLSFFSGLKRTLPSNN